MKSLPRGAEIEKFTFENDMSKGRNRAHLFTWNNYPTDYVNRLKGLDCRYIVAGEEVAPGTGTPHIQGYVVWWNAKSVSSVRTILRGCHITVARGNHRQNDKYCRKTRDGDTPNENVYSRGELPADAADRGAVEKLRWEHAWDAAKRGAVEEIPADIRIRQYSAIRRIERDYMPVVDRLPGPCGLWIYGESGTGKTQSAKDAYPDAYPKPCNIWWDGYQREETIILDDLDKYHVKLGGVLKHWLERYPFISENKGGSIKIRPKRFIVTSQYKIQHIWQDRETCEAIMRRCVIIEKFKDIPIDISWENIESMRLTQMSTLRV